MRRRASQKRMAAVLKILAALMDGESLGVRDVLGRGHAVSDSAARRRFALLEAEIKGVSRSDRRPHKWSFEWPEERQTSRTAVLAVQLAQSLLAFLEHGALDAELDVLVKDLMGRLPAAERHAAPDVSRMFFAKTRTVPTASLPDVVDLIARAMFDQQCIEYRYTHFRGNAERVVLEPYSLVFHDEGLYCIGSAAAKRGEAENPITISNLARMRRLKVSKRAFVYPRRRRYDPEQLFRHCFGLFIPKNKDERPARIVLRFAGHWGTYLQRHQWHATQTVPTKTPDGRFEVGFRLYLLPDLVRWIVGLGHEVEVVRPEELKHLVREARDGTPAAGTIAAPPDIAPEGTSPEA